MSIDWIAVAVATMAAFFVGGVWYSPLLFARPWMKAAGVSEEAAQKNVGAVFGQALVSAFVTALAFGFFMQGEIPLNIGLLYGAVTGLGIVAASLSLNYAFERRPLSLLLINGGYYVVQFTLYGLIF